MVTAQNAKPCFRLLKLIILSAAIRDPGDINLAVRSLERRELKRACLTSFISAPKTREAAQCSAETAGVWYTYIKSVQSSPEKSES